MNSSFAEFDEYLASIPDVARATLQSLRRTILDTVPDAVELISYGMPTFKYRGKPLIYFAAAKNHCAVYGTSRGTIRFPMTSRLPKRRFRHWWGNEVRAIEQATTG